MTEREIIVLNEDLSRLEALQPGDTYVLLEDVSIVGAITSIDYVQFDLTYSDGEAEGRLQWNQDDGTLEYGLPGGNVNLQIGQEHVVKVRNNSGSPITNGQVLYVSGSHASDRIEVSPAKADAVPQALAAGIATEDIANASFGYMTTFGIVRDINTLGFTEGGPIFLSSTVAGGYQQDRPVTGSAYAVFIGYVIKAHATEGSLVSHITIVPRLDRLSGVKYEDPSDGESFRWNAATSQYELSIIADPTVSNPNLVLYVEGDADTDGSIRFINDTELPALMVERRESGIWQPYSFEASPTTMWVGHNVGVAGIGHHLATEAFDGHMHFHAHSEFDDDTGLSVGDTKILDAVANVIKGVFQSDATGHWTGTTQTFTIVSPAHLISNNGYLRTGTTAATQPVRYRIFKGTDDTGHTIFDRIYPASNFPASTEIQFFAHGYIEFETGQSYYHKIESAATFSLEMDVTVTNPWFASDYSVISEDHLLQAPPWVTGTDYSVDDWVIEDREIYACLTNGVQTGTFADNTRRWNSVADHFDKYNSTTGWLHGGDISINAGDDTLIDITAGSMLRADYTDPENPVNHVVHWPAYVGVDPGFTGTQMWIAVIGAEDNAHVISFADEFNSVARREAAVIGRIWNATGAWPSITTAANYKHPAWGLQTAFQDFILAFGAWNMSGNVYSPDTAGNLLLDKSVGMSWRYHTEETEGMENIHVDNTQSPVTTYLYLRQGAAQDQQSTIDPNNYDNAGVKTAVPAGKWTIQEVWLWPVSEFTGVLYGQNLYDSKTEAELAVTMEEHIRDEELLYGAILRAHIVVQQGATDLTDTSTAILHEVTGLGQKGSTTTAASANHWVKNNGSLSPTETDDYIGIGTTSPSHMLSVYGGDTESEHANEIIARFSSKIAASDWTGIGFGAYLEDTSKSAILHKRTASWGVGDLIFAVNYEENSTDVTVADAVMTIRGSTKYVGIGENDPDTLLHIKETSTTTGINCTTALKIEQTSTGDVGLQFINPDISYTWYIDSSDDPYGHGGTLRLSSSYDVNIMAINATGAMILGDDLEHVSMFTVAEDSICTGESGLCGITSKQVSAGGDASINWLLDTLDRWTVYIDDDDTVGAKPFRFWSRVANDDVMVLTTTGRLGLGIDPAAQLDIYSDDVTSGRMLNVTTGYLTTGNVARFHSSSNDTSVRDLVHIHNNSVLASDTTVLKLEQDVGTAFVLHTVGGPVQIEGGDLHIYHDHALTQALAGLIVQNIGVGDASVIWKVGISTWVTYIDNSDEDKFKIADGASELVYMEFDKTTQDTTVRTDLIVEDTLVTQDNVGVGIAAPIVWLDVAGSNVSGRSLQLRSGDSLAGFDSAQIIFTYNNNPYDSGGYGHSIRTRHNNSDSAVNAIDFWLWNMDTLDSDTLGDELVMTLTGEGNVGIGTTAPNGTLHLVQDINASALYVDVAGVTTGNATTIYSNSVDTGTRNLFVVHNDNVLATDAIPVKIIQDAADTIALKILGGTFSHDSYTTDTPAWELEADSITTAFAIDIQADGLTTGGMLQLESNSASPSSRSLAYFHNDHASANNTIVLEVEQDANFLGLHVLGTGVTTDSVFQVDAPALTTGQAARFSSNASSSTVRSVVEIINDNPTAVNACGLTVKQDADENAICLDGNGVEYASVLRVEGHNLIFGGLAYFYSNGADNGTRYLVGIHNDNPLATGARCLELQNDAGPTSIALGIKEGEIFIEGGGGIDINDAGGIHMAAGTLTVSGGAAVFSGSTEVDILGGDLELHSGSTMNIYDGGDLTMDSGDFAFGTGLMTIDGGKLNFGAVSEFVVPRMTTIERDANSSWTNGSLIYNTTLNKFQGYEANAWYYIT